jgi:thiol-disulfide isomerase/thioredoxin
MSKQTHSHRKSWLLVLVLLIGIILVSRIPTRQATLGQPSPATGQPLLKMDLLPLTESRKLLPIDQVPVGKVVLLHFWGTWCTPCKMEYPAVAAMADRWQNTERFRFLPVSSAEQFEESFELLRQNTQDFFTAADIQSFSYYDPFGLTRQAIAKLLERDKMYYPTTILLGTDGVIAGVWEGYNEAGVEQMEEAIEYLLRR